MRSPQRPHTTRPCNNAGPSLGGLLRRSAPLACAFSCRRAAGVLGLAHPCRPPGKCVPRRAAVGPPQLGMQRAEPVLGVGCPSPTAGCGAITEFFQRFGPGQEVLEANTFPPVLPPGCAVRGAQLPAAVGRPRATLPAGAAHYTCPVGAAAALVSERLPAGQPGPRSPRPDSLN